MVTCAVNILTGFLGSGKTTLLKHVLQHGLGGKRVAVIVNEIGEIGIDGKQIECLNVEQMIELTSGCICCSVGSQFALALQSIMATANPHLLIIETTGLADPINLAAEVPAAGFRVDATITVVDAENLAKHLRISSAARRQIATADFLVLNKLDLVTDWQQRWAKWRLRLHNRRALIVPTTYGAAPHDLLFGTSAAVYRERLRVKDDRYADHLSDDGIGAFVYERQGLVDRERFEQFLKRLPPTIYRAKGIVRFDDGPFAALFNFTCGRYDFDWYRIPNGAAFTNQGVFIGKETETLREEILQQLARCVKEEHHSASRQ
jgi:G3E family GTPase